MKSFLREYALYIAWVITLVGLISSVFFGEILHHEPCRLCWYQRICLFPLAIILGIAAYKDDVRIVVYAMPLCALGGLLALYQVVGIFVPAMSSPALCGLQTECSKDLVKLWGFLSFPLVSLIGFFLVFCFLWMAYRTHRRR